MRGKLPKKRAFGSSLSRKGPRPDTFDAVNVGQFRGNKLANQTNYAANQSARHAVDAVIAAKIRAYATVCHRTNYLRIILPRPLSNSEATADAVAVIRQLDLRNEGRKFASHR